MLKIKPPFHWLMPLVFVLLVASCSKKDSTPVTPPPPQPIDTRVFYPYSTFVMGADLSYVNEVQDYGGVYKDSGLVKDPYTLFKDHGANTVRVRLWNNPQWMAPLNSGRLYSDLYDVEKTIRRARNAGMAVNLDLHYSDIWADPGNQKIPAAWTGLSLTLLKDSVYRYTLGVLNYLKSKNLTPEMIQVGNETNQGILFNTGKVINGDFNAFGVLLNSGIRAVRDFSATSAIKPAIILHVAKPESADYYISHLITAGVTDFDILGISYYFVYSNTASLAQVGTIIKNLKTLYNKKIMIAETAYPWTSQNADSYNNVIPGNTGFGSYGISKDEQLRFMKDLTQQVITNGGSGLMYWEPAWITSSLHDPWGTGSSWENNAFFDFSGNAIPGINFMTYPYVF